MTEETKPFTVSDRRHFTPEGSVRDEAPPETAEKGKTSQPKAGSPGAADEMDVPVDFSSFLLSLGAQAAELLAGAGEADDRPRLLREARSIISILEMLKEKTEGRRTDEEERVVQALLYELRMSYVSAARVSGA
jgi:hypothetical protein